MHLNGADDLPTAPRVVCENEAANLDHTGFEEPMVPAMSEDMHGMHSKR